MQWVLLSMMGRFPLSLSHQTALLLLRVLLLPGTREDQTMHKPAYHTLTTTASHIADQLAEDDSLDSQTLALMAGGVWIQDEDDTKEISGVYVFPDGSRLLTRTCRNGERVRALPPRRD